MKVVGVVPIKLNSSRLHNKNIMCFDNGLPLCNYILDTMLRVKDIDEVYVYCSNPNICNYLPDGVKYLRRSPNLDLDTTKINEVLLAFANDVPADVYVMAHVTAPFIRAESIQKGLEAVIGGKFDSSFAAKSLQEFLWKDGKPFNYSLDAIPRTQDLPQLLAETSSFYIYKDSIIKEKNRRIGERPYIVQIGEIESVDIDEKEDFDIANALFSHYFKGKIYD